MFKTRFIAIFLCLTTVFATFAGVSFAEGNVDEETIVIENGKVVSGDSTLVDEGFIVIVDDEEKSADEASGDTAEDEAAEEEKEEMTEDAKLQYILGNLGAFFKPIPQENAVTTPSETPSAVNPSAPSTTPSAIPAQTAQPNVADVDVPDINHPINETKPGTQWRLSYNGRGDSATIFTVTSTAYTSPTRTEKTAVLNKNATLYFAVQENLNYSIVINSAKTLEMLYDASTYNGVNFGTDRSGTRGYNRNSTTSGYMLGRYMFSITNGGTLRIIGGNGQNDPHYGHYEADGSCTCGMSKADNDKFLFDCNTTSNGNGSDRTSSSGSAPAFYVDNGTLEIRNAIIRDSMSTTANGRGAAIHARNGSKVFLENVVFDNCGFVNPNTDTDYSRGGCIYIYGDCTVTMKSCRITNSVSGRTNYAEYGGAICVDSLRQGVSGTPGAIPAPGQTYVLQIQDTVIQNSNATLANSAYGGGAIYIGKVVNDHSVTIKNSTIQNCYTSGLGGAIFVASGGKLDIDGDSFTGTSAKGAIKNCHSTFAEQTENGLPAGGGGIYAEDGSTLRMKNIMIKGCYAQNGDGGGVYSHYANVDMIGCRLDGNYITDPSNSYSYTNPWDNKTVYLVAGIKNGVALRAMGGTVNLVNTTITNHQVGYGTSTSNKLARGVVYLSAGAVINMIEKNPDGQAARITNCDGGAVYVIGSSVFRMYGGSINNAIYRYRNPTYLGADEGKDPNGNKGYSNGVGVILHTDGTSKPTFEMYGGTIEQCKNQTIGKGGAIGTMSGGTVVIYGGTIGCAADGSLLETKDATTISEATYGSAIYMDSTGDNKLYIAGGTIANGQHDYGAIYLGTSAYMEMTNGTISGNTALKRGGGIYAAGLAELYIKGGVIENNEAVSGYNDGRGGGISAVGLSKFFLGENGTDGKPVSRPIIKNNSAPVDGGGIFVSDAGVYIYDAEISGNSAQHGAGIYVTPGSVRTPSSLEVTIKSGDIENNVKGSGIWITSNVFTLNITGGNISGNTITDDGHSFGGAGICATIDVNVNISGTKDSPVTISNNKNEARDYKEYSSSTVENNISHHYDTRMHGGGIACVTRNDGNVKYNGTLTIKGNVTISGNSVPSNGVASETSRSGKGCGGGIFMEEGGTVNIESVIENGVTYKPTISSNTAYRGGGVYVSGAVIDSSNAITGSYLTKLTVNGAVFENNVSTENQFVLSNGSASNPRGLAGGAICAFYNVDLSVSDATFTSNRANMSTGTGGGAISAVSANKVALNGCEFTDNYVGSGYNGTITGDGGAVFCRNVADVDVTRCTMTGNKAQQGGGLYVIRDDYYEMAANANVDVDITGSEFSTNNDGGLFFQRNATSATYPRSVTVDIGNTTINGNTLGNHGSHKFGGAGITCANGITLNLNSGTVISGNTNNVEYVASGSTEGNDTAANGGGVAMIKKENVAYITAGTLTVNGGVTISGNTAKYGNGGGIYVEDGGVLDVLGAADNKVIIENNESGGTMIDPSASTEADKWSDGGGGGGVFINKVTGAVDPNGAVTIKHANIIGNRVHGRKADGGGLNVREASLVISDCLIQSNQTTDTNGGSNGGGLDFETSTSTLTATNCKFIANSTTNWGGGLYIAGKGKIAAITDCVFDGNYAVKQGGGFQIYNGPEVTMSGTYMGNNVADGLGGAILMISGGYSVKLDISNSYIGKLPDENGQVVDAGNRSGSGGGIYVAAASSSGVKTTLTLGEGVDISNNNATASGGGIYFAPNADYPVFEDVVINNNFAGNKGGGIYVTRSDANNAYADEAGKRLDLNSCTIKDNEAKLGGGVYANNTIVTVKSSNGKETLFENNTAAQGGAIYLDDGNTKELTLDAFKISGTTKFISNEANGFVDAENSENNLSGDGGAIYVNGGRGFIVNSVFEKNTAEDNGGAVYINGNDTYGHYGISTVAFGNSDSTLSSTSYNSATNGNGGAVCVVGGHHFVVVRGGFYANQAPNGEGGGVYVEGVENTVITRDATVFNGCHSAGISNDIENFENLEVIFSGNQAGNGGAVAVKSDATLDYTRILYNTAYQNGGGIYAADGAVVTANRLVVFYNDALNNGGGLCAVGSAQITCNTELGAAIYENDAQNNGGGVYVEGTGSKVTLGKGYIYKNWAGYQTSNKSVIVATMPDGSTTMGSAANVHGVGGGVAVFDGGAFEMKDTGAIYDNRAAIGARDVFANGSDTKLTILAANAIDKDGERIFDRPAHAFVREDNNTNGMWWEDYKNGDTMYTNGLYGDPTGVAQRYEDSAVSIRAFVDANEDAGGEQYSKRYVNMDDQFVSIVFEVQKYNVGTITITAPEGEGVENQRFVFEVKGDPVKGDDFTLSISLLGGESVTITDLVPGTYTITQKTDWSWRFDYKNVTITGIEDNVGVNKGNGVVEITIKGTTRDEAHAVVYDNEKVENKWLSHNSEGVENVAKTIANVSFDMAEAKKGYVI